MQNAFKIQMGRRQLNAICSQDCRGGVLHRVDSDGETAIECNMQSRLPGAMFRVGLLDLAS